MRSLAPVASIAVAFLTSAAHAAPTSFTCKFPIEASPRGVVKQTSPFELRFVSDPGTKKAYILGNNGSAEVRLIEHTFGVAFIEITATGNVMVTTIAKSGEAVHSRNTNLYGKLTPSQSYGTCTFE